MVLQQMKMLLLSIVTLLRRALCCLSRRRKLSHCSSEHQLQAVSVIVERDDNTAAATAQSAAHHLHPPTTSSSNRNNINNERDWNSWDDSPRTVEEHIEQYRQRIAQPSTPPKEEPEPDFFSDLTPNIKPQVKYFLDNDNVTAADTQNKRGDFSRLQAQDMLHINVNADLEDWVDDNAGGWEELDTSQTKQIIRENRRELRNQRQPTQKPPPPTIGAQRLSDLQRVA